MSVNPRLSSFLLAGLAIGFSAQTHAQTIVIDPGHGGHDPGAVGCGLEEEDVVLDVSQRAASILRDSGLTVHMTRSDDRFIELAARSSFANARGAARFVSIHANANAGTPATGTETFIYTSASSTSRSLGQGVQDELISTWGLRNRGLKTANFSVLRRTSMPAALAELGFINRCSPDAGLLGSASERARIATGIARAILRSVGRSADPPPTPPTTTAGGRLLGVAFEDVGVGLEDTTRRISGATVRVRGRASFDGTTNSSGTFVFDAPSGDYTVELSKSGFVTSTRTCTVTAGDTWCSVGLGAVPSAPARSIVRGVIYEDGGAGLTDSAARLSGALVRAGDAETRTDASGGFELEVSPGSVLLTVGADGYESATRSCAVSGAETWCSVGLVPSARAGVAQGVVYADGDVRRRVTSATVTILETGLTTRVGDRNGYWGFEVAAGTYTVRAEAAGFSPTTRSCTVTERGESWCSMGLISSGSGGSAIMVDERPIEEAAGDPRESAHAELTGGCSASGTGTSTGGVLLLLLAFVAWRRRSAHIVAMLALSLTACGDGSESVGAQVEALQQDETEAEALTEGEAPSDALALAREVRSFARIREVRQVASGDYIDLELSPTGTHVAVSHAAHAGLSVVDVGDLSHIQISDAPRSGYEPLWRVDGAALGVRTPGQTSTAAPMLAFGLDGSEAAPVGGNVALRVRVSEDGAVLMRDGSGTDERLAPPGDQYFEPRASSDGRFVVFRGLSTGLYVHRVADGATFMVGRGSHTRFDPQGRYLVFERLEEDGHEVTGSSLWLMDLNADDLRYGPIAVDREIPRAPSIAGSTLAFMSQDAVFTAQLAIQ